MWRPLFQWGSAFAKIFKEQYVTFLRLREVMKLPQRSSWPTLLKRSTNPGEVEQRNDFGWEIPSRNLLSSFTHTNQNMSLAWPPKPHSDIYLMQCCPLIPPLHNYFFWLSYGNTTLLFLSLVHKVTKKKDDKKSQKYVLAINRLLNCLACFNYFIAQLQLSVLHSKESFSTANPELWFKQHSIRNFSVQQNTTNYNQHWQILIWH